MPRQNRVTPYGDLIAVPDRGLFMGNRGCLHGDYGQLGQKRWTRKAWVTCLLDYRESRRELMAPGQYTELFFLDEATALAAGHRPCAQCRRADYARFKQLWLQHNAPLLPAGVTSMAAIDEILHGERVDARRRQRSWRSAAAALPAGSFVKLAQDRWPWLVWNGRLWEWSPGGYRRARPLPQGEVEVLTPPSVTRVLSAGYRPRVHPSADPDAAG